MERKWTLKARVRNPNNFLIFWNVWTALMVISQWIRMTNAVKAQLDRTAYHSRRDTDNKSALVKASKNEADPATDEVSVEHQSAILTESQCSFHLHRNHHHHHHHHQHHSHHYHPHHMHFTLRKFIILWKFTVILMSQPLLYFFFFPCWWHCECFYVILQFFSAVVICK